MSACAERKDLIRDWKSTRALTCDGDSSGVLPETSTDVIQADVFLGVHTLGFVRPSIYVCGSALPVLTMICRKNGLCEVREERKEPALRMAQEIWLEAPYEIYITRSKDDIGRLEGVASCCGGVEANGT